MGFHVCEYCSNATSSGDVTLEFDQRSWVMPDMIAHYVQDHGYQPPPFFILDIMQKEPVASSRRQTKGVATPVGYLSGAFPAGSVPTGFVERLRKAMGMGARMQTRGFVK